MFVLEIPILLLKRNNKLFISTTFICQCIYDHYFTISGVFLNEFFKYAGEIINGTNTQRVRVYSAHDANVYSLQSVSQVKPRQGVPKYGSVFSLELRRVIKTGEYVVLVIVCNI